MAQEVGDKFSQTSRPLDRRYNLHRGSSSKLYNGLDDSQVIKRFFKVGNMSAALLAILIAGPIGWMFLDRTPPYIISEGATVPRQIKRGHEYRIQWKFNNLPKSCSGTVYRFLIDSSDPPNIWVSIPSAATFGYLDESIEKGIIMGYPRILPPDVALGPAEIHISTTFLCNFTNLLWKLVVIAPVVHTTIVD